jgi:hypothetical protein
MLTVDVHKGQTSYGQFIDGLSHQFAALGTQPLFTTDADNLWEIYLNSFSSPEEWQYHNCNTCKYFIRNYGGLVTILPDGTTKQAIAIPQLTEVVEKAVVTGVFYSSADEYGKRLNGGWEHLSVRPPTSRIWKSRTQMAHQASAEKLEDFKQVRNALNKWSIRSVDEAVELLKTDALYRSEKLLGQAEWLQRILAERRGKSYQVRANILWLAVATAPAGFCHPSTSMIATVLDDLDSGKKFDEVAKSFATKMHPLKYQRPQAPPKAGQIEAAEKLFATLEAGGSLKRRFLRLEEVQAIWKPTKEEPASGEGIFSSLKDSSKPFQASGVPTPITWEKFASTVLPSAKRIQFLVPHNSSFGALVTASDPSAPPIIQWDSEEQRNPVSWYLWHGGSDARQFGLTSHTFVDVEAIALKPHMWNGNEEKFAHHGKGLFFVLSGARESRSAGLALFPEILKSEFHGVRAVLEAYSRKHNIEGMNQPHVAGLLLTKATTQWGTIVRVTMGAIEKEYRIERWD